MLVGDARLPEIIEPELEVVIDLGFLPPVYLNGTIYDYYFSLARYYLFLESVYYFWPQCPRLS
jgi:hypothetical protein